MTFQSAKSNLQVSQEPIIRKTSMDARTIPIFDSDGKVIDSGIQILAGGSFRVPDRDYNDVFHKFEIIGGATPSINLTRINGDILEYSDFNAFYDELGSTAINITGTVTEMRFFAGFNVYIKDPVSGNYNFVAALLPSALPWSVVYDYYDHYTHGNGVYGVRIYSVFETSLESGNALIYENENIVVTGL